MKISSVRYSLPVSSLRQMAVNKAQMGNQAKAQVPASQYGDLKDHDPFQETTGLKIDVTLLLPETGFLLIGEFFT